MSMCEVIKELERVNPQHAQGKKGFKGFKCAHTLSSASAVRFRRERGKKNGNNTRFYFVPPPRMSSEQSRETMNGEGREKKTY